MDFILLLFALVLVPFVLLSGPIAFIWLFFVRNQLDDLTAQNARLESILRRLQHDIHTNKTSGTASSILTIEAEEQSARAGGISPPAVPPIRPAAPVVPFAVPAPTPTTQSPTPSAHDSGVRFRSCTTNPAERTAAQWAAAVPWSQSTATQSSAPKFKREPMVELSAPPQSWELFIGRKLFGWVAVLGFILAAALLIMHGIKEGWITNEFIVGSIAAFGAALLGVGYYCRRTGLQRFSTMMSCAGIVLIYLAGYTSYAIYRLVEFQTASVLMPLIVLGGFLLAWFYRSRLLGMVTILGGLAVPILVASGEDHYRELFIYLLALNIGTLVLVNLLRRTPIAWIAFFGTQVLFWMWHTKFLGILFYPHLDDPYPVHKLIAALIFQATFYMVFLTDTIIAALKPIGKKLRPTWDDAMRAILTPIVFFGAIFVMSQKGGIRLDVDLTWFDLHSSQRFLYDHLGIFAFIGAAWYALLAVLYSRHLAFVVGRRPPGGDVGDSRPEGSSAEYRTQPPGGRLPTLTYWHAAPSAAVVIALGFVAVGIPLQFDAMWITLGWLTVFAGLWYFGHRQKDKTFVVMALAFFALGMFRFITEIADQLNHARALLDITPVFNPIALPMLACSGVLIVAAALAHRFIIHPLSFWERAGVREGNSEESNNPHPSPLPKGEGTVAWGFNHFVAILGYLILGVILSGEAARYIYATPELWEPYSAVYLLSAFLLGFWFTLAIVLLQVGFVFRSKVIAGTAFVGLAIVELAMLFVGFPQRFNHYDMWAFNNPYSVVLIVQSIILLAIGYQSKFVNRHSRAGGNPDGRLCSLDPRLRGGDVDREGAVYQTIFGAFGVVGLFSLLAILTIEWFNYFEPLVIVNNVVNSSTVLRSITSFWSLYALFWITVGFASRNLPIRICGMIILFGALLKTTLFDSSVSFGYCSWEWSPEVGYSLENWTLLVNPYFMTMLCPVIPAMVLAVWTHQSRILAEFMGAGERIAWKVAGIIGLVALLIYLSVECYQFFDTIEPRIVAMEQTFLGATSLTVLWTVAALLLTTLALCFKSKTLRIISMVILWVAVMNVLMGLDYRPEFTMPFLNLFFTPTLILAAVLIALTCLWLYRLPEDSTERKVYRFLAFVAVIFLWLTMSVECYRAVQLQRAAGISLPVAQMALSILWSLFAGVLIAIGFVWRSPTLRWMAILLFAATLTKILIVDMAGVNELYRFGAVFALAMLLALATWAYQRFKLEE
ncbi:MAG: DUF2339 domain-containing protein [Planctomycetaceae bacterium]|nr:DUF2339 domain-containing protein [Planctomycetaceae bacterium]